ncbi:uncharacterized protein V1510DRAFT_402535 [Dipodascopsis tothii]|uniref:uncharacterized protein n=1 Tax=Dipodascopsis tothii TaxID=44089 RepID=UPI0034CE72B5
MEREKSESTYNLNSSEDFPAAPRAAPKATVATGIANSPLVSILSYCGASILMTVTNKYVLSGYSFNLNFFLLMVQSLVCVSAIQICKTFNVITYRDFNAAEAKKWFPISVLLVIMIYTSSKALQFLSIPVYTIFKNLTIILIAYGEVLWFGGSVSGLALFSFGLMVLSSVVAAWGDIKLAIDNYGSDSQSSLSALNAGYIWMFMNCLSSATYVLGMRKRIKLTNFKDFDTMFYNNLLSIPVLLVCSLLIEDWSPTNVQNNFPAEQRTALIIAMIFSGLSSVFISYTSAWCVRVTSSTTYSMVGALNKLPIALSGLVFFDAAVNFLSISSIIIGFLAGLVYAVAKIQQSRKPTSLPVASANADRKD